MLFFEKIKKYLLCIITASIISSCGGNDCKYPENKNGIWQDINTARVTPINPNVVLQSNSYGAITLRDGATELKARDNLWVPIKLKTGEDAIVEAGNQVRLNVSDSIVLAGYLQQIPVILKDWINPAMQPYSFAEVKTISSSISNTVPNSVNVISTLNADNTVSTYRVYDVPYDGKTVSISEKDSSITNTGSCQGETPAKNVNAKINYAFYFVKKIEFNAFPTPNGVLERKKVVVTDENNSLKCSVKQWAELMYVCSFTYNGHNWEYARRVKPGMLNGYPQFEEQINCTDNEVSEWSNPNSTANPPSVTYRNNHHYLMCIVGGSTPTNDYCKNRYGYDNILYSEKSVQEYHNLPNEYQEVATITSDGSSYIDTGVKPDFNAHEIIIKNFKTTTNSGAWSVIFGVSDEDGQEPGADYIFRFLNDGNKMGFCYGDFSVNTVPVAANYVFDYTLGSMIGEIRMNKNGMYVNGVLASSGKSCNAYTNSNYSYYIFSVNQLGSPWRTNSNVQLGEVIIKSNGTIIRDYIPCYRVSDNKPGYYELVNKQFYQSSVGSFRIGEVLNNNGAGSVEGYKVGSDGSKSKHSLIKVYFKKYNEVYSADQLSGDTKSYGNGKTGGSNIRYKKLCKALPKTISYSLNKYKDAGFGWVNRDNTTDQESIKYCSNNCIDLCTEYFKGYTHDEIVGFGGNDDVATNEKYLLHFWKYVPTTDIKGSSYITNDNYKTESCGCSCSGFKGHLLTTISGWQTLTSQIRNACQKSDGWYGMYASASSRNGNILNYVHNNSAVNTNFQIVKLLRSWDGTYHDKWTSGSNLKSYFLCSPYSLQTGNCDYANGTGQCRKSNSQCYSLGQISYTSASLDLQCPVKCEKPIWEPNQRNVLSANNTTNFEVVSQIEYTIAPRKNGDRQGQLSDNEDNTMYYEINNGNTIDYGAGYLPLRNGLLTTESPEVTNIVCYDVEPDDLELFEVNQIYEKTMTKPTISKPSNVSDDDWNANSSNVSDAQNKINNQSADTYSNNCKVSATFNHYDSSAGSNLVKFYPQTEGIIPIQWSSFTVAPGDSVPLTISVAGSGAYPILVKSNSGSYIEFASGNGLVIYLQPNYEEIANSSLYAEPNKWQCNVGAGGSYGFYKPYLYDSSATNTCGKYNPRHIKTHSTMWWYCAPATSMWFSGYDYDGIKTGSPYSFHKYTWDNLNYMLPNYAPAGEDTSVSAVGCNADGVPTSITLSNGTVISKAANQLDIARGDNDVAGSVYQYSDDGGNLVAVSVNDGSKIKSKTFEQYSPEMIVATLPKLGLEGVTITKSRNNLRREKCSSSELEYCYKFTYEGQDMSIDVSSSYIGRNGVYMAECLENASSETGTDTTYSTAQILTELPYEENSDYYFSPDKGKTIYTRLGAFAGFNSDASPDMSPVIYELHNQCMGKYAKFIYDEQGTDHADEEGLGSVYSYLNAEGTKRENLERSWRMEFGHPDFEEWSDGDTQIGPEKPPKYHENHRYTYGGDTDGSYCLTESTTPDCSADKIPDIMFVDLNNAVPKLNKKAILYKSKNGISSITNTYRLVTCPAVGWNNEKIITNRSDIVCKFDGFEDSCNYNATVGMVIEVYKNGQVYECKNADKDVNIQNVVNEQFYKFDYDADDGNGFIEYQIQKSLVPAENRVCFADVSNARCRSWLKNYITYGYGYGQTSTTYLYSLGRAPYMVSCGAYNYSVSDSSTAKYNAVYGSTDGKTSSVINVFAQNRDKFNDFEETNVGITMQYGIKALSDASQSKYFARCVPNWVSAEWMLLNNQGDPSSFEKGFNAMSGSYFVKSGSTTWESVKNKYAIDEVHQRFGGIISNDVYSVNCNEESTGISKQPCSTSHVSQNFPRFQTIYERQIILAKSIINDPVNASPTDCAFVAKTNDGITGNLSLKMNDPFGTQFPNSMFKFFPVDRYTTSSAVSNISNTDVGNGDGRHGYEFFKFSEIYRNIIGAGIVHPSWWMFTNSSNGEPTIFYGDKTMEVKPSNQSKIYFAGGNLSHASRGYCLNGDNDKWLDKVEGWWTAALTATAAAGLIGWAIGTGFAEIADQNAKSVLNGLRGAMIDITNNNDTKTKVNNIVKHNVYKYQPSNAARYCGVGTAFRVLPIPHFACFGGYRMRCNNERINEWVDVQGGGNDTKLANKCIISTTLPEYSGSTLIKVGSCVKQKYNISSTTATGSKQILMYKDDNKVVNNFREQLNNNFDEYENMLEEHCGVCLKKNMVQTYNGITYGLVSQPNKICDPSNQSDCFVTRDNCKTKKGYTNGEEYTWITQLARLTPWDSYSTEEQEEFFSLVKNKFTIRVQACSATLVFEPTLTDKKTETYMKDAYSKAGIRNEASCISALESMYMDWITEIEANDDCKASLTLASNLLASSGCSELLEKIKTKDGDSYDRYIFTQNASTTMCIDDETTPVKDKVTGLYSLKSDKNKTKMLEKYGFAELSSDTIVGKNEAVSYVIDIPQKIKGKKFKSANVGFAFAGDNTANPMKMYTKYRVKNANDLQRGYDVQIGTGTPIMRGKYLYLYWQPLLSNGTPDPTYEPNAYFNPRYPNFKGMTYTPEQIVNNNMVYDYKQFDLEDTGEASFTSPRTGKLWAAIIDAEIKDGRGRNTDELRDGKYIIFKSSVDGPTAKVSGNNYLGSNSGQYYLTGSIQQDSLDAIDSITAKGEGTFVTKTLFSWLVSELKELLLGKWHKAHTDENGKYVPAGYDFEGTKLGFVPSGLVPQLASVILKQPLIHIAFWLVAVVGMFAFGFQVLFGSAQVNFDLVKKYLFSYAIMTAFLNPASVSFYFRFVVRAAFNLADGLSAYVAGNFAEVNTTYDESDAGQWVAVAFGPIDKILRYFFNFDFFWRWTAIILSSITGWVSAIILLMCLIHFLISALQALILYIMILLQMSLQLAIGPIMLVFLVHEKTRDICVNWLKCIAGMIAEQVAMFTALSAFSTLFYHILKGSMNFIICWEPVIKIPILDVTLFSWWKIAGTLPQHMAELMGEYGPTITGQTDKFSVLTGITLLLITMAMSKFIDKASEFGAGLFGQSSSMPGELKALVGKAREGVNQIGTKAMTAPYKAAGGFVANKATGAIDGIANAPYNAGGKVVDGIKRLWNG